MSRILYISTRIFKESDRFDGKEANVCMLHLVYGSVCSIISGLANSKPVDTVLRTAFHRCNMYMQGYLDTCPKNYVILFS